MRSAYDIRLSVETNEKTGGPKSSALLANCYWPNPLDDVNGWLVGDVKLGERSLSAVLVAVVLALQLEIDEPDSPGEQGALQEAKRIIRDM